MTHAATNAAGCVLQLRGATPHDARLLLAWANDAATRAASLSTAPITWDEHLVWLEAKLASTNSAIYIALADDEPVGQVRFDMVDHVSARISVAVAPHARGRGVATPLIEAGIARYCAEHPGAAIVAEIRVSNDRSRAAFIRAGFVERSRAVADDGEAVARFGRLA